MKKIMLLIAAFAVIISTAFAATGTIHIVFDNGQIVEDAGNAYYEFDVKAYISEGNEVLGAGMIYVEYPVSVFGEVAIWNNVVTAEKTGILAGTIPEVEIYLYDIIENDTYTDVFAITFESTYMGNANYKEFYSEISNDPLAPSDLMHISMLASNYGTGYVSYPGYIAGIDNVFYNYEFENFSGGLNITEASEEVLYEDPDPDPVGSLEWKSFTAGWKKNVIELKWSTRYEVDIVGYVVKRSENGGEAVEIASYETDPTLVAVGDVVSRYEYNDASAMARSAYTYTIEAIDIVGAAIPSASVEVLGEAIVEESYPNPFNPSFVVPFELFTSQDVNIKLYDMTGRVVRNVVNSTHGAGHYEYHVNCSDLSSGVYFLRTVIDNNVNTQKMLLVK